MDTNMTSYLTSNYIKAEDLAENVVIEASIASVTIREFEETGDVITKPVIRFDDGRGVVLNQTRLKALIGAFGPHKDNWLGRTVRVHRGQTFYQGRPVPAVEIEPVVAPRLEGGPAPATIEGPKSSPSGAAAKPPAESKPEPDAQPPQGARGRVTTITSGRQKGGGDLAARKPDLAHEINDEIPF